MNVPDGSTNPATTRYRLVWVSLAIMTITVMIAGCAAPRAQKAAFATATPVVTAGVARPTHAATRRHSQTPSRGVFLAEGQDINGTTAQRPRCSSGCPLSAEGTIVLYDMTWRTWKKKTATGTGTETIQSCTPSCSAGEEYKVKVDVTLSRPVRDCATRMAFWTRARFRFPLGLQGAPVPSNPWTFSGVAAQAARSCRVAGR